MEELTFPVMKAAIMATAELARHQPLKIGFFLKQGYIGLKGKTK